MKLLSTLIRKDLLEQWRNKKILTLLVVFLFAAIASPIIAKITPDLLKSMDIPGMTINLAPATYLDSIDQFVKNIGQIALLVLVFVVAGAIADEKSKKTLEIVLTKPVSREMFVLSKFKSYFISISAIFLVAAVIFYTYTASIFSAFNLINFLIVAGCMLAYILMISAISILASTVVSSPIAAGGIGFVFYILFGTITGLFKQINSWSPGVFFSDYKHIIINGWNNDWLLPLVVSLIFIIIAVITAIFIFKKQEIER